MEVPVFTKAFPPEVYPDEDTSDPVVNEVVDFPNVAVLVYIANLNLFPLLPAVSKL